MGLSACDITDVNSAAQTAPVGRLLSQVAIAPGLLPPVWAMNICSSTGTPTYTIILPYHGRSFCCAHALEACVVAYGRWL